VFGGLLGLRVVFSKDGEFIYPDEVTVPLAVLVYSSTLGGNQLQFYKDGFIKIDSPTQEEALERLNCLVLCFRLLRLANTHIPVFKSDELCTVKRNYRADEAPKSIEDLERMLSTGKVVLMEAGPEFIIESASCTPSSRSVFAINGETHEKGPTPLININANELEIIAELAERVFSSKMKNQLVTFIEAWTLRGESDWNTGFILSWICIETMVFNQIIANCGQDAIYQKYKKGNKKGRIQKHPGGKKKELPAYDAIETLRTALRGKNPVFAPGDKSAFDETYLDGIQLIREIRNEIVHGNRRATEQELEDCFLASWKALWRMMRLGGIDNYSDYLARMEGRQFETEQRMADGRIGST
jgi:hypothetical protein